MAPSNQETDGKQDTSSFAIKDTKTKQSKTNYTKQLLPAGVVAVILLVIWAVVAVTNVRINSQTQTNNASEVAEIPDDVPAEQVIQEEQKAINDARQADFNKIKQQIEQAPEGEELLPLYISAINIGIEIEAPEIQDYATKALAIFEQDTSGESTEVFIDYIRALELISQGNFSEGKQAIPLQEQQ